ncbi:hypothetical protein PDESU_06479 [Pontiella desulfatans]|uniref:DUF2062 domain-containing protein n=1 Tax=Pontiella desulfatans TaxID=2750659 RepID=A0A6C2UEB7_PONDE|nr:DUF2062 domain-containing protein [Pontiella desulfatans]VGO17877.1 hypothetical protein PDESU_06479 [Pontiella desulfatans]
MNPFTKKQILQTYLRLMKHKGSPECVGRGVATGLAVAFVVPFSFQMLVAFPLAILFKAAKLPALLFTWITNPVTIPVLYPLQCFVGSHLVGRPLSYGSLQESSIDLIETPTISKLLGLGADLVLAFFAGGLLFGTVAALIGYVVMSNLVRSYRERTEQRKARRLQRAEKSVCP